MFKTAMIAAVALSIGGMTMTATAASAEPRGFYHGGHFDHDGWRGGHGWRGGYGWRGPIGYVGPGWGYYGGGCGVRWSPYYGRYVRGCW